MQTPNIFKCQNKCQHRECQRHVPLGCVDQNLECDCLKYQELNGSTIFLENIIDLSHTLCQIMILCGIHECKAKSSIDLITYAFLHYDLVCYCVDAKPKKRLRKEDLFHELGRKCLMNRVEAHLAYTIIKRGFKAFYYRLNTEQEADYDNGQRASISEQCVYIHAAKKTAECYAQFEGLSCIEKGCYESKIKVMYKKFYDRMQSRKSKPEQDDCNCCFCAKKRGDCTILGKPQTCVPSPPSVAPRHKKPCCCSKKKKFKFIHPRSEMAKCPVCHRAKEFCCCPKYDFSPNWVESIWSRPDMEMYYKNTIEKHEEEVAAEMHAAMIEEEELADMEEEIPIADVNGLILDDDADADVDQEVINDAANDADDEEANT